VIQPYEDVGLYFYLDVGIFTVFVENKTDSLGTEIHIATASSSSLIIDTFKWYSSRYTLTKTSKSGIIHKAKIN